VEGLLFTGTTNKQLALESLPLFYNRPHLNFVRNPPQRLT